MHLIKYALITSSLRQGSNTEKIILNFLHDITRSFKDQFTIYTYCIKEY